MAGKYTRARAPLERMYTNQIFESKDGTTSILGLHCHAMKNKNANHSIDGFHCDVIKMKSQNSEVLRILIYTRLKINKSKSLYKFPFP